MNFKSPFSLFARGEQPQKVPKKGRPQLTLIAALASVIFVNPVQAANVISVNFADNTYSAELCYGSAYALKTTLLTSQAAWRSGDVFRQYSTEEWEAFGLVAPQPTDSGYYYPNSFFMGAASLTMMEINEQVAFGGQKLAMARDVSNDGISYLVGNYRQTINGRGPSGGGGYFTYPGSVLTHGALNWLVLEGECPTANQTNLELNGPEITASISESTGKIDEVFDPITFEHDFENSPINWGVSPALPTGLSMNTATGTISGTPTAYAASAVYTVIASEGGDDATVDITIEIEKAEASFTITTDRQVTSYTGDTTVTVTMDPSAASGDVTLYYSEAFQTIETKALQNGIAVFVVNFSEIWSGQPAPSTDFDTVFTAVYAGDTQYGNITTAQSSQATLEIDVTAPRPEFSIEGMDHSGENFTVDGSFGEEVVGFDASRITVTNGSVGDMYSESGNGYYRFTIVPIAEGIVTVNIASGVVNDLAGHPNAAANQLTMTYDTIAPTVEITGPTGPVLATFSMSIVVSDQDEFALLYEPYITVTNGSVVAGSLSGSDGVYTVNIEPTLGDIVTVLVAESQIWDRATNGNIASNTFSVQAGYAIVASTTTVLATYNEAIEPLTFTHDLVGSPTFSIVPALPEGLTLNTANGTISGVPTQASVGPAEVEYTVTATDASGSATKDISIHVDKAETTFTTIVDRNLTAFKDGFTVTITMEPLAVTGEIELQYGDGFPLKTVALVNGVAVIPVSFLTDFPSQTEAPTADFEFRFFAAYKGNDTYQIGRGPDVVVSVDVADPSVTLTTEQVTPHNGSFVVTAQFIEPVTGFDASDITVTNGHVENLQAGAENSYTFTIVPDADGNIDVSIASGVVVDGVGRANTASNTITVMIDQTAPTIVISGPTEAVTEEFGVEIVISEAMTGFSVDDVTIVNGTLVTGSFIGGPLQYSLRIVPEVGTVISVSVVENVAQDDVGNPNEASNIFTVQAGSPASEFAKLQSEIRTVVVDQARRALSSTIAANRRMTRRARTRFMISRRQMSNDGSGLVSRNNVGFDVDGIFSAGRESISTKGTFFQQRGNYEGTKRRLFWGDFDIQRDSDTGSTTATLTGRLAWEQMISDKTMLGYFIGAELGHSNISGAFNGSQDSFGLSIGAYGVTELNENLFLDGFVTLGIAQNSLDMSTDILDLKSDYVTRSLSFGGSITGVIKKERFEIWPELSFAYGRTQIGNVQFSGQAYGLTDNNLSLDAGSVTLLNIMLRPEFRMTFDGGGAQDTLFTFAPRLICESVKTDVSEKDCGGGIDFGVEKTFRNGLGHLNAQIALDRIGKTTRPSLQISLKYKF